MAAQKLQKAHGCSETLNVRMAAQNLRMAAQECFHLAPAVIGLAPAVIGFAPAVGKALGEACYGHSMAHSGRSYGSLRP